MSATLDTRRAVRPPPVPEPDALALDHLSISYRVRGGERRVLDNVSFGIGPGESYGLVGESGCGKSTVALAAVRALARNGRVSGGTIAIGGHDLMRLRQTDLRDLRRTAVSMVHQNAGKALNPTLKIGRQIAEIFELQGLSPVEGFDRATLILGRVQITDPAAVMNRYPHHLSGGMQQRVAIAMALAIKPKLLILDEPTTGLDPTIEAEILDLIARLRREFATAVLFISHSLGVIARMCDRVGVLYAGRLVEDGPTRAVFDDPRHPYTVGLLRCLPRAGRRKDQGRLDTIPGTLPIPGAAVPGCIYADRCGLADQQCRTVPPASHDLGGRLSLCHYPDRAPDVPRATPAGIGPRPAVDRTAAPVLSVDRLAKTFRGGGYTVRVLSDISLSLWPGETLGLVGESGSGKTMLAHMLLGLIAPDEPDRIELDGQKAARRTAERTADQLKALQIVFQNPDSALNRAHSVRSLVGRALITLAKVPRAARLDRLLSITRAVHLADRSLTAKPGQLSGGQQQRVAIARAFAGEPRIVICDEPTAALDVSVQAAILNLLVDHQAERRVSYILISHDLGTVRYLSDRIAVLYMGRLMEIGPAEQVFRGPHHPYTEALLSAVSVIEGGADARIRLRGAMPSAIVPPSGCMFHTRCPRKLGVICEREEPPLHPAAEGHDIRCHIPAEALGRVEARAGTAA